ncbi:MAG: ATP-dependent DNA helicase UvrD2 [Corynebacterium sp.]|nr:ATP-dependent DNA helicase UvrD2 [Corynebacterium sp.]
MGIAVGDFSLDLGALDEDQRVAATAARGPVCILAGAGTGKTRTITYRIAHMVDQGFVSPQRVLAVTFTAKAAGEMRDRLLSMGIAGVQARTFHAAAMRQLQYFWPQVAGDLPWKLVDNKFPIVGNAVRSVGMDASTETVRDILSEIEWAKASLISADGYQAALSTFDRTAPKDPAKVAQAYRRYEQLKAQPDGMLLDFDDLLIHVAGALENAPAIAEEFRAQYRSFVVDEYQDVTPLQQRVLNAWLGERDDVTVVGDANQTIYSFTGATPNFLLDFSRTYDNATIVKLQRDYRSTPQITELANTVIEQATGRAAGTRLRLEGMREDGPQPQFHAYDGDDVEAKEVAGQVLSLLNQGVAASEIAILYRTNFQSQLIEEALADAGVVYQVRGGEGFFRRREVVEATRILQRATQRHDLPNDPVAIARAAFAGIGLSDSEPEGAKARERWQSLRALVDLIATIVRDHPGIDLQGVLVDLHRRASNKQAPTMEGVTLSTFHAAKGLEWDAVFLIGLTENLLPIRQAIKAEEMRKDSEAIEEERRLFYVGITRARVHLFLSWALAKTAGSRLNRQRTRFLDGIVPELGESAPSSRVKRPTRCRLCELPLHNTAEKVLGRHEDCEPEESDRIDSLFAALRAWRADTARDIGKPAFVVFSDATLMAIAERMPGDANGLVSVPGIGPQKLDLYGEAVLDIVRLHRS